MGKRVSNLGVVGQQEMCVCYELGFVADVMVAVPNKTMIGVENGNENCEFANLVRLSRNP